MICLECYNYLKLLFNFTEKMSKGKGQAGLGYSHPLVKNLEEPVEEDHQIVLPSYQPIIPNNTNRISSKIARCTYIPNTNYKKIAMTVSPFNNAI